MERKVIKDDLRYLLFSEIYHGFDEPKGKRKAYNLIENAIQCFARKGFDNVTLEMIAREAGVTRPLLKHYFKDADDIQLLALKYIRVVFQKYAIDAMERHTHPPDMLAGYVESCVQWTIQLRTHAVVWTSFMHMCGRNKKFRAMNTTAVSVGTDRIQALIEMGKAQGFFKCGDTRVAARMVQVMITGAVFSSVGENIEDVKNFSKSIVDSCLKFTAG